MAPFVDQLRYFVASSFINDDIWRRRNPSCFRTYIVNVCTHILRNSCGRNDRFFLPHLLHSLRFSRATENKRHTSACACFDANERDKRAKSTPSESVRSTTLLKKLRIPESSRRASSCHVTSCHVTSSSRDATFFKCVSRATTRDEKDSSSSRIETPREAIIALSDDKLSLPRTRTRFTSCANTRMTLLALTRYCSQS